MQFQAKFQRVGFRLAFSAVMSNYCRANQRCARGAVQRPATRLAAVDASDVTHVPISCCLLIESCCPSTCNWRASGHNYTKLLILRTLRFLGSYQEVSGFRNKCREFRHVDEMPTKGQDACQTN